MGGFGVLSTGFGFPGEMGPSAGLARLARDLSTTDSDASRVVGGVGGDVLVVQGRLDALWITPSARFARTIATPARSWSRGTCV